MAEQKLSPKKQRAHVFVWMHAVFARGNGLQNRAHALAAALAIHADPDGSKCFPSLPHLMEHANQSQATIYRAKDDLVAAGLLAESRNDEGRRMWELVVPEYAVTSCKEVLTSEKTNSPSREESVLTSENVPTQVPEHGPAQDLADARSSGEPESDAPAAPDHEPPEDAPAERDPFGFEQCDRDWAAIESKVAGFNPGERRCVSEMLLRGKPRAFIVNTIQKRRKEAWRSPRDVEVRGLSRSLLCKAAG